jgi:hypothetical protein
MSSFWTNWHRMSNYSWNYFVDGLKKTFGRLPCPLLWGIISDILTDICNTLLECKNWNHTSLYDSISESIKPPNHLPDNIPFHKAKEFSIEIPTNDTGKVDIYINDTIAITPVFPRNIERMNAAVPLAIRTLSQPLNPDDEILRKDIISLKKFQAEACPEEVKTILGWIINTRSLTIALPDNKCINLIHSPRVNSKQLESSIG